MTTPTTEILCPDCKCNAWGHFLWAVGEKGGCNTDGCKCTNTPQQAIEKWAAKARAEARRAALLEVVKIICPDCRHGYPVKVVYGSYMHYGVDYVHTCFSADIHALLAQEQERAQEVKS